MKIRHTLGITIVAAIAAAACNNGNAPFTGAFRVVNAIPDSAPLDANISQVTTDVNNIAFGSVSGFRDVPEGSYAVQITTAPAAGGNSVTIDANNVSIDHNNQTTLYAVGTLAQNTGARLSVERNSSGTVPAGKTEVQFVDAVSAALTAGTGTVYIVNPGQGTSNPVYTVTLQSPVNNPSATNPAFTSPTLIASGTYEIIIQDQTSTTVFDSGSTGVSFGDGATLQIAALDATPAQITSNTSLIQLLDIDNSTGNATVLLNGAH